MKNISLTLSIVVLFGACNSHEKSHNAALTIENNDSLYVRHLSRWDSSLTNHFPRSIVSDSFFIESNHDTSKGEIGLTICEYNFPRDTLNALKNKLRQDKSIVAYRTSEKTLMVVRPILSTGQTSQKLSNESYSKSLPVPSFWNCRMQGASNLMGLDTTFEVYVVGAGTKKYTDVKSNEHLPKKWGHGYSKGISISETKSIVVYWTIIW